MTHKHMNQQLVDDLKAVLQQAEELLESTAGASGERLDAARRKLSEGVATLRNVQGRLQERLSDALRSSGRIVREHPYETAAGGGLVLLIVVAGVLWLWQRSR